PTVSPRPSTETTNPSIPRTTTILVARAVRSPTGTTCAASVGRAPCGSAARPTANVAPSGVGRLPTGRVGTQAVLAAAVLAADRFFDRREIPIGPVYFPRPAVGRAGLV